MESGAWKVDAAKGTASVTADDTVAELAATRGTRLAGRWLSLKVVLTGDAARAGLRFSGLRDDAEQTLRIVLDAAEGGLTNGRAKTLAPLPAGALQSPVEIILTFSKDRLLIEHAGVQVAELAVKFEDQQPAVSLLAERGTVVFREVILSGQPVLVEVPPRKPPEPGIPPVRPDKVEPAPEPVAGPRVAVDFTGADMRTLKSGWNDYFGVHVDTGPGPWKTIRQYDGPGFGMPPGDRHTGAVKTLDGPFAKMPVQMSLGDFGDWKRKDAGRLDSHIKTLADQDRSAIFIAPWVQPFTFVQQDQVWAFMKLLYGGHVAAEGRIFFQWGDDITSRRLGAATNRNLHSTTPRASSTGGRRGRDDTVEAYVEYYFAPAVEAVRLASSEVYKDPARIPVLMGSALRPSDPINRAWLIRALDSTIAGEIALSLKGRTVCELVDYITLDYPFFRATDANALQEFWDRYGMKVKGLWVTSEYGATGKGPADLIKSAALYLDWAARMQLDASRTRLIWNLPEEKPDKPAMRELVRKLGESFTGPLRAASQKTGETVLYRIAAGDSRMLLVNIPPESRRARRPDPIQEITLTVPAAQAARQWTARILSEKDRKQPAAGTAVPVEKNGAGLVLKLDANARDTWALIVEAQ